MKAKFTLVLSIIIFSALCFASAKERVVVLPFRNMDGATKFNTICFSLGDSLRTQLQKEDPNSDFYEVVSKEQVQEVMTRLAIDPNSPQYDSDIWKAVEALKVTKVVTGNFNSAGTKLIINAYIYDITTKLADPNFAAKNLFKKSENALETIPAIVKNLLPGLKKS